MATGLDPDTATRLDTAPVEPARAAGLGPVGWGRWAWRQLTSMRTALLLLLLLALLAVPGSLLPQRPSDPAGVQAYAARNPGAFPLLDRLWAFDVYASPWFSATYLLLFVSLVGCVLPRSRQHWRAVRARPPAAPRRLERLPVHRRTEVPQAPAEALAAAERVLRRRRYRVSVGDGEVAAEKGHLRETGNLVFHLSLLLLLVAVALGSLRGFEATVVVPEGDAFANTRASYDSFSTGARFDETGLVPFRVALDRFDVRYQPDGPQAGAPREFAAHVRWSPEPGAPERTAVVRPNHPLEVDGTKVFLTGNGYAPLFTVRDGDGDVVHEGPVVFLPRDGNNTSTGVVKAPDASPQGLGFTGLFLPSAAFDEQRGPVSTFPDLRLPRVVLTAFAGDLGGDGTPQSVYTLDTSRMEQLTEAGEPVTASLAPGDTLTLPDGLGSVTFDGVTRFANFQVAHDPGRVPALLAAVLALAGLMASLFVRRRRVWARVAGDGTGPTVVEVAGLSRTEDESLPDEVERVARAVGGAPRTDEETGCWRS